MRRSSNRSRVVRLLVRLTTYQGSVKRHERRRLEHDGRTQQATRPFGGRNQQVTAALVVAGPAFRPVSTELLMTNRSTLDPTSPLERSTSEGRASRSIGPSDSSDAGSDLAGLDLNEDDTTDREGTGERLSVGDESVTRSADGDIGFDRVVGPEEAGLGGGLDQAEEARAGITDEEIAELARRGR